MKKFILSVFVTMAMLFTGVASAEFVVGVQGGWAQADIGDDALEGTGLTCGSDSCDGGDDFGFGLYAQWLTATKAGNAVGIHIGYASYSFEADIKDSNFKLEYDADILDVLGVMKWKGKTETSFFLMAGYSEYDASGDGFEKDGGGVKFAGGWEIGTGNVLITPTLSYADYGDDITNTAIQLGIGYKF